MKAKAAGCGLILREVSGIVFLCVYSIIIIVIIAIILIFIVGTSKNNIEHGIKETCVIMSTQAAYVVRCAIW